MVSKEKLREIALSFPEATEEQHFVKTSFRVNKKIFATYDAEHHRACLKLSEVSQGVYTATDKTAIYAVGNKWGKQGWTNIELSKMNIPLLKEILISAYCEVAPMKLSSLVKTKNTL